MTQMVGHEGDAGVLGESVMNARRTVTESLARLKSVSPFAPVKVPAAMEPVLEAPVEAAPQEPAPAKLAPSIITVNVEMTGTIKSADEMHIYGTIDGDVRAAALTICTGGAVRGDLAAPTIVIDGVVEGRIFGEDVRLNAGARVIGEINARTLGVDPAAIFEGAVKRMQDPLAEAPRKPAA